MNFIRQHRFIPALCVGSFSLTYFLLFSVPTKNMEDDLLEIEHKEAATPQQEYKKGAVVLSPKMMELGEKIRRAMRNEPDPPPSPPPEMILVKSMHHYHRTIYYALFADMEEERIEIDRLAYQVIVAIAAGILTLASTELYTAIQGRGNRQI